MRWLVSAFVLLPTAGLADIHSLEQGGWLDEGIPTRYFFNVTTEVGQIADLELRVSISHPRTSDLRIGFMTWPGNMMEHVGDGANFQDTYLDDEATLRIGDTNANTSPFAGPEWGGIRYKPQYTSLSFFDGMPANERWGFIVYDPVIDGVQAYVNVGGEQTSWGTAIGTQLIIRTVPEPGTLLTLATGVSILASCRRKRTKGA